MAFHQQCTSPRVWLITGCSSGFGKLFVSLLLARGDRVIATARDISTLSEFAHRDDVKLLQLNVTDSQDALNRKISEAVAIFGQIDVLVNNAGYVLSGVWEELSQPQILDQFNTNVFGPLNLTRALLPHMRARQSGTVIFMSSIAGWRGVAVGGPYSASKFALEGAAESLQKEIVPFGIDVHLAVLGQFRTDILAADRRKSGRGINSIQGYDDAVDAFQTRLAQTNGKQPGDPAQAVQRILDLVRREGHFAAQRQIPFRIFLGSDAVDIVRGECQDMLSELQAQEELGKSTDYSDTGNIQSYE
ncbi:Glucose/ribitol dehydrogenase [Penicillium nucicola]|uniref:Glucose/ribitol dehydrogenase n=1 Tax=Penicillium nucicola TaxID=1850975 RepID=UPI0025452C50|nr:Glucose/ribitol dehydrogenase [Penicillium nucicola]KAJ5753587.1 Glucose/ribitol dehydrogenase [Penicillium nucicola]